MDLFRLNRAMAFMEAAGITGGDAAAESNDAPRGVAELEKDGWLVRREGRYVTSFVGDGTVVLSGKPRPDLFGAIIRQIIKVSMGARKTGRSSSDT